MRNPTGNGDPAMNLLDGMMLLALVSGAVFGYVQGLIRQLVSLLGWIAAMLAGYLFYDDLAPLLESRLPFAADEMLGDYGTLAEGIELDRYMYNALAFAIVLFGAKLLIWAIARMLHGVASLPVLRTVNRLSGALLGLLQAAAVAVIILLVMDALPSERIRDLLEQSVGYSWLERNKPAILAHIAGLWR